MSSFRKSRFVPQVETLEDRIVPAGVLVTKFLNNVLTITGQTSVDPDLQNQNFALLGAGEGHVSISVQDGETIQGKNSFNSVWKVILKLNEGDDVVTVVDLKLARPGKLVDFQGGSGDNSLFFDGNKIDIANLTATSGTAATSATDTFTMAPTEAVQMHFFNVTVNCPNADCDITLGGMKVDKVTKVTTGTAHDDVIEMDDSEFKMFTLNTGGGHDVIAMGHLDQDDQEDLIFAGICTINMGDGDDSLTAGITVHGAGDGSDLTPDLTRFLSKVLMDGGDGDDIIEVHHPRSTEFVLEDNPVLNNWEVIVYNP